MTDIPNNTLEKSQVTPSEWWKTRGELWRLTVAMIVTAALNGNPVLADTQAPLVQPGQTITQNLPDGRTMSMSSESNIKKVVINGELRYIIDWVLQPPGTKILENKSTSANVVDRGTVNIRRKTDNSVTNTLDKKNSVLRIKDQDSVTTVTNMSVSEMKTVDNPTPVQNTETQKPWVKVVFNSQKDGVIMGEDTNAVTMSFKELNDLNIKQKILLVKMFPDEIKIAYQNYLLKLSGDAKTSDGRSFATLTDKDVDALTDKDYSIYQEWNSNRRIEELVRIQIGISQKKEASARIEKDNQRLDQENEGLDIKIKIAEKKLEQEAVKTINLILTQIDQNKKISVGKDLYEMIKLISQWKVPPADMQEKAKQILPFITV